MEKNVVQQTVETPILKLKLCNSENNQFKTNCYNMQLINVLNHCHGGHYKKHSIDHVLPSGIGWEASVAKQMIQCRWNYS